MVFLLQKPDSSSVLGKNDLQIVTCVVEFIALAKRLHTEMGIGALAFFAFFLVFYYLKQLEKTL